jgi:tRNA threonylcarbamoyladenosine dehydratase
LGNWVYFPWLNIIYHLIDAQDYYELRTARNRDILDLHERHIIHGKKIAIAGLSVGMNIALTFLRYGIGSLYRISDFDSIALSNFNRTFFCLNDFGSVKSEIVAKDMAEIDPYIKIEVMPGLSDKSITKFTRNIDLIIDAMDNFALKAKLRDVAKKRKIPVISGFDIENDVLVFVERYDTESNLSGNLIYKSFVRSKLQLRNAALINKNEFFINFIGEKYHSPKMLESVRNVGVSLTGFPQQITASLLLASSLTLIAQKILLGKNMPTFSKFIPLSQLI